MVVYGIMQQSEEANYRDSRSGGQRLFTFLDYPAVVSRPPEHADSTHASLNILPSTTASVSCLIDVITGTERLEVGVAVLFKLSLSRELIHSIRAADVVVIIS
jgi:hypothetical protein